MLGRRCCVERGTEESSRKVYQDFEDDEGEDTHFCSELGPDKAGAGVEFDCLGEDAEKEEDGPEKIVFLELAEVG